LRRYAPQSFHAVFALKALYSPGGIDQPLLPSIERVTIRADFDTDLGQRGPRFKSIAAGAGYYAAPVCRMYGSFHFRLSEFENNIARVMAQIRARV
jgi:hypothetical protein